MHSIVANYGGDPGNAASSSAPLSQTISAPTGSSNVALASAGAVASASSSHSAGYPVAAVNNNERAGANPGNGGYWNDATPNVLPDSVQIVFNGSKTIDRVVVYSLQDNYLNPVEPTDTPDLQPVRPHQLYRRGPQWRELGDPGHGQRQQPGQAHGELRRLHHRQHPGHHHRHHRLVVADHRNRGLGRRVPAATDEQRGAGQRRGGGLGVEQLQRRLPGGRGQQQRAGRGQPGQRRLLERRHPEHVAGLGADRLQRQQDASIGWWSIRCRTTTSTRSSRPTRQTFSLYGLTGFTVEGRNGANWVTAGHGQRQQPGQAHA